MDPLPAFIRQRTVPDILAHAAATVPANTALIASSSRGEEVHLTYQQLLTDSARIAAALARRGVRQGDRVGILVDNRSAVEAHLLYHAAHRLGAINVPLNFRYLPGELEYALQFAGIKALLFDVTFGQALSDMRDRIPTEHFMAVGSEAAALPAFAEGFYQAVAGEVPAEQTSLQESDDADWIFTSGTTGRPKVVAITHGGSAACAFQSRDLWHLTAESVYQSSSPFFTSTGCHTNLLGCLAAGCTYVVETEFDARKTAIRIGQYRSTHLFLLSGLLYLMLERVDFAEVDLASLRYIAYGGGALPKSFYERLEQLFVNRHGIKLVHLYGLTEGGTAGLMLPPEDHHRAVQLVAKYGLSIGNQGFNEWVKFRLVDDEGQEILPGDVGEICLRAPSVMDRYVDDATATAEALKTGWLHTGDIGTVDAQGFVYFVDRKKQLIRRGGINISSMEIEAVLLQFPGVLEAAVVPRPNPVLGEEPKAVVVLKPGLSATAEAVITFCRQHLAHYKVPVEVLFVQQLPRNPMGKVVKSLLTGPMVEPGSPE